MNAAREYEQRNLPPAGNVEGSASLELKRAVERHVVSPYFEGALG